MQQAYGYVYADGSVELYGSNNFTVRKDPDHNGTYYIDCTDVFTDRKPAIVLSPRSFDSTAIAVWTEWWYTGTIQVLTGLNWQPGQDCDFSFIAMRNE